MSDTIDFDYSRSYKVENSEFYNFITELQKKIITYLQAEKNPENKQYMKFKIKYFLTI